MEVEFTGEIWFWRGPSPFFFVTVPEPERTILAEDWMFASYGWGMLPVTVRIGRTRWATSLFQKDGGFVVPIKQAVRNAEQLDEGDTPKLSMTLRLG